MNQKLLYFLTRIDSLTPIHKSKYGKMNVNQMVCHCTDFYHTALKEISLIDAPKILKENITIFFDSPKVADFSPHFYFGSLTRAQWNETSSYHLRQ